MLAAAFRPADPPPLVRDATETDLPALLAMAERFIGQAWSHVGVPYCRDTAERLLRGLMDGERGFVLVDQPCTAMMGVALHCWHFNADALTATELFWWAEPSSGAGKALLDEAERRAKAAGAATFNMGCMEAMRADTLGRFYRRLGFRPSEHIYIKELG